jgi:hypothetical protein
VGDITETYGNLKKVRHLPSNKIVQFLYVSIAIKCMTILNKASKITSQKFNDYRTVYRYVVTHYEPLKPDVEVPYLSLIKQSGKHPNPVSKSFPSVSIGLPSIFCRFVQEFRKLFMNSSSTKIYTVPGGGGGYKYQRPHRVRS